MPPQTICSSQRFMVVDYETFSVGDLKKLGSYEYARHPSTEILCASWRVGTREELRTAEINSWCPELPEMTATFGSLLRALRDPTIHLVAHNALFEQVITTHVLGARYMPSKRDELSIPPERWSCTASLAAALALPRSLEEAAMALKLQAQKDMEGRRLMLKWTKPRRPTKYDPSDRHQKMFELKRIIQYCEQDIETETELFLRLPPLNPLERKIWELDQKINLRGFLVDRPLVSVILGMIEKETEVIHQKTKEMTLGKLHSVNQRDKLLRYLQDECNVGLLDLQAKTVEAILKHSELDELSRTLLEFRQAISKTSTAKYEAFDLRSSSDSRVRDILLYWAASTGRWGGRGVQPQNLKRSTLSEKQLKIAIQIIEEQDLEMLRLIFEQPMEVFSSLLRSMIIASPGKEFHVADYAAVETRVLFWLANHEKGVQAFVENRDLYKEMAQVIYNLGSTSEVTKLQRQVGKGVVLGCGYSMGAKKFLITCMNQGIEINELIAAAAVQAYRSVHSPVVALWNKFHLASIEAVKNPGKKYKINSTWWWIERGFLWVELPSKRRLAYSNPQVRLELTPWGDQRPVLYHWGVNSLTKKWELTKTYGGLLVENVVQAIARDLMAEAMLRIEETGVYEVVLSIHDELLTESSKGQGSARELEDLMSVLPAWAEGCPIRAEGWTGNRYRKG